jgi:hypothetical protein
LKIKLTTPSYRILHEILRDLLVFLAIAINLITISFHTVRNVTFIEHHNNFSVRVLWQFHETSDLPFPRDVVGHTPVVR